jgi:biofilm PGA synthesis N-glycosyltransferase PgaC
MIVYTYFGYPLLLAALARLRPKPQPTASPLPSVTLLIAAYNEEAVIARKLDDSLALDYPRERLQILVAADGSDDRTVEIVQGYGERGVELAYSPERRGKMAAINRAIRLARGEIVVFSDANNLYDRRAIRELAAPFGDPAVGAVTGAKRIAEDEGGLSRSEGLYWKYESFIKQQETRLGCAIGAAGEILAIRRELFRPPPENIINDDFYIAAHIARRGYRVVYTPEARSYEPVSASAEDEKMRRARIVAGRYQIMRHAHRLLPPGRPLVAWEMISHKFLRPLVPLAMIGALAANVAAVVRPVAGWGSSPLLLAPPTNWILLGLQVVFYGLAWIGSRVQVGGWGGRLLYLPTFLVNSNLAALTGLVNYVTGRQSHVWQRVRRSERAVSGRDERAGTESP